MGKFVRILLFILLAVPLIISIIFISVSVKVVKYGNYALRYNSVASKIMDNNKVYTSGRYMVGIQSKFITFPSKDQLISVDDIHIVNDMSAYELGVSAIYSIDEDRVYDIYTKYSTMDDFEMALKRALNHTFSTKASDINFDQYFLTQEDTQEELQKHLEEAWEGMGVSISSFFIDYVTFTDLIENKLISEQIASLNNTYQTTKQDYNDMLVQMNQLEKQNEVDIGLAYAQKAAQKEYYRVMGELNKSRARANMLKCMYDMFTQETLKPVQSQQENPLSGNALSELLENLQPLGDPLLSSRLTSHSWLSTRDAQEGSGNTDNQNEGASDEKGIQFTDEELISYIKQKALYTTKTGGDSKQIISDSTYTDSLLNTN